jgi:hypothetical protein
MARVSDCEKIDHTTVWGCPPGSLGFVEDRRLLRIVAEKDFQAEVIKCWKIFVQVDGIEIKKDVCTLPFPRGEETEEFNIKACALLCVEMSKFEVRNSLPHESVD